MLYGDFICLRPLWGKHEDCSVSRKGDHGRRTRAPKPPPDAFPGLGEPPVESDPWDTFGGHARSNAVLLLSAKASTEVKTRVLSHCALSYFWSSIHQCISVHD